MPIRKSLPKKKRGRKITCDCGVCSKCKTRERVRKFRKLRKL